MQQKSIPAFLSFLTKCVSLGVKIYEKSDEFYSLEDRLGGRERERERLRRGIVKYKCVL